MPSNTSNAAPPENTTDQALDVSGIDNEPQKIHRNRRREDRNKRNSGLEGQRKNNSGGTRSRTISLLEISNLERDHSDAPNSERGGQENVETLAEVDHSISSARRKRREKHRRKVSVNNSRSATVISTVIGDLIEEETPSSTERPGDEDILVSGWEYPFAPPKAKNISYKQYVEQISNNKFSLRDLDDLGETEYNHSPSNTYSPVNVAIAVQKCFRPFASLCCGVLGGISLWQCFTMLYWNSPYQESFLKYYPDCARTFQSLYYLLAVISLVSVLDSCDLSHLAKRNFWYTLSSKPAPLMVSFTLIASLIVSLVCAPLDDKLALAVNNNWNFEYNVTSALVDWDIEWWVTVNYVRCVGAVLTWILFSLCLGPDALRNQLINLLNAPKHSDRELTENKNQNGN